MKTYRQKLAKWVNQKKTTEDNPEVIRILDEITIKIKEMEPDERDMVNNTYEKGYIDGTHSRGRVSNYYNLNFKTHDILSRIVRSSKEQFFNSEFKEN